MVILNSLINIHETIGHGARYFSPDSKEAIKINIVGFVDDCACQVNEPVPGTLTNAELLRLMQRDAQLWRDLLYTTGGGTLPYQVYVPFHVLLLYIRWRSHSD